MSLLYIYIYFFFQKYAQDSNVKLVTNGVDRQGKWISAHDTVFETAHDKTYNKICATSEDSDQPALIACAFANRMCLLQSSGYLNKDKREPLCWVNVLAPVSILYKSTAGRYQPVRVADGPITARYRFIKNASRG